MPPGTPPPQGYGDGFRAHGVHPPPWELASGAPHADDGASAASAASGTAETFPSGTVTDYPLPCGISDLMRNGMIRTTPASVLSPFCAHETASCLVIPLLLFWFLGFGPQRKSGSRPPCARAVRALVVCVCVWLGQASHKVPCQIPLRLCSVVPTVKEPSA